MLLFRIAHAISPIIVVGLSTVYLILKRWRLSSKYTSNAEIESITVSLVKRRAILISVAAFETIGWLYQFIQYSLGSDQQDLYDALNLAIMSITWVCKR